MSSSSGVLSPPPGGGGLVKRPSSGALSPVPPPPPVSPGSELKMKRLNLGEDAARRPISVVIFGATGDLAKKKLYPALYQLMLLGRLPREKIRIVGFGRRDVDMAKFVEKQCANVKRDARLPFADFAAKLSFCGGGAYDRPEGFLKLRAHLEAAEGGDGGDRLFFLSVPPTVFGAVAQLVSEHCRGPAGYTRLIIEKPFGRDSESFAELNAQTSGCFEEREIFRIDHYLGKEVVLNLSSLRFANQIFEPTWNAKYVESVEITFKEDIGCQGRGGYFDGFGIVRDIMQNHLLQVFVLCAMEPPTSRAPEDVMRAKVALLEKVATLELEDAFLGQFTEDAFFEEAGYLDDPGVPDDSVTPTFAAVVLNVDNDRWRGVPFLMKAGKGLDERLAEVRVRYRAQPYNALLVKNQKGAKNELVCRIQPDEALYLKTHTKKPGLGDDVEPTVMDMRYSSEFGNAYLADAYERMFLNAAKGDSSLFVSADELVEAWRIFTPMLKAIDAKRPKPVLYPFGARNPRGFPEWSLSQAHVKQRKSFMEHLSDLADDVGSLRACFYRHDADKDGVLNEGEVKALAKDLYDGRDCPDKSFRKFFQVARGFDLKERITFHDFMYFAKCAKTAFRSKPRAYSPSPCSEK